MAEEKMRTFEYEGKRRGIRLDSATWAAIDWLAAQRDVKWAALAHEWLMLGTHGPESDNNLTRVIRASAMAELLNETVFAERAEMHASAGPLWRCLGMCDDEGLRYALGEAQGVEGHEDFGGFTLHVGASEVGKVAFYVENNLKGCPSVIVSTPFTLEQWVQATEGAA